MTFKDDFKTALQLCAESATGGTELIRDALLLSIGNEGEKFQFRGETRLKGTAYVPPGFIDCLMTALSAVIDNRPQILLGLTNIDGGTVTPGDFVRIGGDRRVIRATDVALTRLLLGVVVKAAASGQLTDVAISGSTSVKMAGGLTPVAGELLRVGDLAGILTTIGAGAVVGQILDASPYNDSSNLFVDAVLRVPIT